MSFTVKRRILGASIIVVLGAILYFIFALSIKTGWALIIASAIMFLGAVVTRSLSKRWDWENREVRYDPFYIPTTWSINGFLGTYMRKGPSKPYLRYLFFHVFFVPIFPVRCFAFYNEAGEEPDEVNTTWGITQWNLLDVIYIYLISLGVVVMIFGILSLIFK